MNKHTKYTAQYLNQEKFCDQFIRYIVPKFKHGYYYAKSFYNNFYIICIKYR